MDYNFKKDFLKGSAAATLGTVSAMFFHFLSIMLLTRNLEKNEFGVYIIILVIANLMVVISGLGLNVTLVKYITGADQKDNNASFRAVMVIRILFLLVSCILFYAFSSFILPLFQLKDTRFVLFIPVLFAFANFRDLFYNLLQGLRLYRKYAIVQTISAAIRVALIVLFMKLDLLSLPNLIYIEISTTGLAFVVQLFMIPLKKMMSVRPDKGKYRELLKFGFPVYLNNVLTFSFDRVSIFVITLFLNPAAVALFDVGGKVPEALSRMFVSFTIVFFPNQSKLFSEGKRTEAIHLMNKSLHFFSISMIFLVLVSFLFSKEIVILLFSATYLESAMAFGLLMLNLYLRILSNIMGYSLMASGDAAAPVKVSSITTVINLAASLILIPQIGFMGGVYALLIMNIISQTIFHAFMIKADMMQDKFNYLRPLLVLAVLMIPYYFFRESVIIRLLLIVGYFLISWFYVTEFKLLVSGLRNFFQKKRLMSIS